MFEKLKAKKAMKLLSDPKVLNEVMKELKCPEGAAFLKNSEKYNKAAQTIKTARNNEVYDTSRLFIGHIGTVTCKEGEQEGYFNMHFDRRKVAVLELLPDKVTHDMWLHDKLRYYNYAADHYRVVSEATILPVINRYIGGNVKTVWEIGIMHLSEVIDTAAHPTMSKNDIIRFEKYVLNGNEQSFVTANGDEIEIE